MFACPWTAAGRFYLGRWVMLLIEGNEPHPTRADNIVPAVVIVRKVVLVPIGPPGKRTSSTRSALDSDRIVDSIGKIE